MCKEEFTTSFQMITLNEVIETINEFGGNGCKVLVTPVGDGLYIADVEGKYVAEWEKKMEGEYEETAKNRILW